MAIQQSDIMDFGNGIIGDDTFDVWRKKTNSLKGEIDLVNTTLTAKINTDISTVKTLFVPIAGAATSVSTSLQFTSPVTLTSTIDINGTILTGNSSKLVSDKEFDSSVQLTSPKVKATSKLILGTKEYTVPASPAINNAVLTSATTAGELQWQNAATLFESSGGLQQTTAVFEEVMPVGAVIACAEDPNDSNFLLCEGGSELKSTYPKLYEVLKDPVTGAARYGETATTFTLPDYSGRVLVGVGTAGSVNFGNVFGADGGDTTTTTSSVTLTAAQSGLPAHRHSYTLEDPRGTTASQGSGNGVSDFNTAFTSAAGGTSATTGHAHSITTANRIQPYVTVRYYIKAVENSKIDFKINVNQSGLKSTDAGGIPQTLISVSNETHSLSVNPDNTSIALDNNFKVSVKSSPTIQGAVTVIGGEPTATNHLTTKNYVENFIRSGEVIEKISGVCDGRSITTASGAVTMPNVGTKQSLTTTYTAITGTTFAYTPPAGTSTVEIEFNAQHSGDTSGNYTNRTIQLFYWELDDGSNNFTIMGPGSGGMYEMSDDQSTSVSQTHKIVFNIDSTLSSDDIVNGKLQSWSSARTFQMKGREWDSDHAGKLHESYHSSRFPTGFQTDRIFTRPILSITAIA